MDQVDISLEKVIANFDFEKVHDVMRYLGWEWFSRDCETSSVPTMGRLVQTAQKLLRQAYQGCMSDPKEETFYVCGTGGFKATVFKQNNKFIAANLEFILTSWEEEDYE